MTLSKRDRFCQAFARFPALHCPRCGGVLTLVEDDFSCTQGHHYNLHRKGCVNFLSTPVNTCYDKELFAARRRVFAAGCYDQIAEAIEQLMPPGEQHILDAGCGDGWYLAKLLEKHPSWVGAGIDISKDAIFQATDHPCEALWCVGDLRRLPFGDQAFTTVLDVLTPANYSEFRRVLFPDGLMIKVYPGEHYLQEIRLKRGMSLYAEGKVEAYLHEHAQVIASRHVTVTHPLTPQLWRDFVWMTPLDQDLSPEAKEALAQDAAETITIDLHIDAVRL